MSTSRRPVAQRIASLAVMLALLPLFPLILILSMLGFSRPAIGLLGLLFRSRAIKRRAFAGYQPAARDVFVCTYSKSGTNWAMQIAYQIAHRGQGEFEYIHSVVPWPDAPMPGMVALDDASTFRAAPTGMRVIKTHLESEFVPYSPAAKYIIVLRDPKEVVVSSYHFSASIFPGPMPPFDWWVSAFLSDRFQYDSWINHVVSFWPWRERPNVLWLNYHEMKADPRAAVERIAALMGVELSERERERVLEKSSFRYMKSINDKFTPKAPLPERWAKRGVMIRQGEAGKSSELLTPAQQARIDRQMRAELRRHGCDLPYDELFTTVTDPPILAA